MLVCMYVCVFVCVCVRLCVHARARARECVSYDGTEQSTPWRIKAAEVCVCVCARARPRVCVCVPALGGRVPNRPYQR